MFRYARQQMEQAETALSKGQRQWQEEGRYDQAIDTLTRALSQVADLPASHDLALKLNEELHQAKRAQAAVELHELADRFRLFYGLDFLPPGAAGEIRKFWNKRLVIMDCLAPETVQNFRAR